MKYVALYLPQFHRIPENDKWWGEGYTDWTAVKNAEPLFEGHKQPAVPMNGLFYDLSNKQTMLWQTDLMREYGVDAFCFYHYWFKNGKMVLQTPAENLLKWKDIEMSFCFSWANETWARTWSGLNKFYNTWASSFEQKSAKEFSDGILLDQKYGEYESWREHFDYLLPFFQDERYVRIEGKPVFIIHKPSDMYCLENMLDCWRELACKAGLGGLYVLGNKPKASQRKHIDRALYVEPAVALSNVRFASYNPRRIDYCDVWKQVLLDAEQYADSIVSAFVKYDDTPRRGEKGIILENASPKIFEEYMEKLAQINVEKGEQLFFINAWNEWGEGMNLEPDEKDGYGYLEVVKRIKGKTEQLSAFKPSKTLRELDTSILEREMHIKLMLDQWLKLHEKGVLISDYLYDHKMLNVAVYGYGMLGMHLVTELQNNGIKVLFIVDKDEKSCKTNVPFMSLESEWPDTDAIIVTAVNDYGTIYSMIKNKGQRFKPISLEHILFESCI